MKRALITLLLGLIIIIGAAPLPATRVSHAGRTTPLAYDITWSPDDGWPSVVIRAHGFLTSIILRPNHSFYFPTEVLA